MQFTFGGSVNPVSQSTPYAHGCCDELKRQSRAARIERSGRRTPCPMGFTLRTVSCRHSSPSRLASRMRIWTSVGIYQDDVELDRDAARGLMTMQRVFAFKHKSALGDAPAHRL